MKQLLQEHSQRMSYLVQHWAKKIPGNLSLLFILCFGFAVTSGVNVYNGSKTLHNDTFQTLIINGSLLAKNLTVEDVLTVNGSLKASELHCGSLMANGSVSVEHLNAQTVHCSGSFKGSHVLIEKEALFSGKAEIASSQFPSLQAAGTHIELSSTTVDGDILIKNTHNKSWTIDESGKTMSSATPSLTLKSDSIIGGNIIFEGPIEGKIFIDHSSQIKGAVTNGQVITRN